MRFWIQSWFGQFTVVEGVRQRLPDTNSPSAAHRCLVLQICCWQVEGEVSGFGIEMVQALDVDHAQDITRAQHPTGRLSEVPAELLDGQDHDQLLAAWLRVKG
jgi:hypothetical protein